MCLHNESFLLQESENESFELSTVTGKVIKNVNLSFIYRNRKELTGRLQTHGSVMWKW